MRQAAKGLGFTTVNAAHFCDQRPLVLVVEAIGGNDQDSLDLFTPLLLQREFAIVLKTAGNLIALRKEAAEKLGILK